MNIKFTSIKKTIKEIRKDNLLTYVDIQEKSHELKQEEILTIYRSLLNNKSIKERFKIILDSIGICPANNNIYILLTELTKLIPFIQNNFNLLLIGEKGTGKSSTYSTVLPFSKVVSGIPSEAILRGNSNDKSTAALLDSSLVVFEEVADDTTSSKMTPTPLLKTFLSSGKFFKHNKGETKSTCSIIITSNDYSSITSFEDIKEKNIFSVLPKGVRDEAFLNRFNGLLPYYKNLLATKTYSISEEALYAKDLYLILSKLKELDNKLYLTSDDIFDDRELGRINSTINGFVKLFYIDDDPEPFFIDFITEWAKHICSLVNPKIKIYYPFNSKSIPFLSKFFLDKKIEKIEYATFLSKNRVLFKFKPDTIFNEHNFEIIALNGFGETENNFDLDISNQNKYEKVIPLEKEKNFSIKFNLNGDLATSQKYNQYGTLLDLYKNDENYNTLLINNIRLSAKDNDSFDSKLSFRGIPKFFERIIRENAKKNFGLEEFHSKSLSKTCYIVNDTDIYFINYYRIFNTK